MLPPGLGFNAVSAKALVASKSGRLPNPTGPGRRCWPPTRRAFSQLAGHQPALRPAGVAAAAGGGGLDNVFARHRRHGEATRRAVRTWGLEILCLNPEEYSPVLTAVVMPGDQGADAFRATVLEKFNLSLGNGLGKLKDRVFRIGHLGDFNDLMLVGTLCGIEMGFAAAGVSAKKDGVAAAMDYLASR